MGKKKDAKRGRKGKGPKKSCCGKPKHKLCKRCPLRMGG